MVSDAEVTLEQLLAFAETNAPAIRVAQAAAGRGDAEVAAAAPLLPENPEVEVGIGSRRFGGRGFRELEGSVRQQIEIAGERGLRRSLARRTRDVARSELDEARWSVHVEVHGLFREALLARERVRVAERVVQFAQELDRISARRVQAGDDSPLNRLTAQAELAQARERLVQAQDDERNARVRLAEVAGWPLPRLPSLRGELAAVRRVGAAAQLSALAEKRHPAYRTRDLATQEAEARERLEGRQAWPKPTLGVDLTKEGGEPGSSATVLMFRLGLPLPLWDRNEGGRARAAVERQVAERQRDAYRAASNAKVERAAGSVNAAADRVAIFGADVVPAVEKNLVLIRRAYDLGELDIQALSQTRERLLETQARSLDAQAEYYRLLTELEDTIGTELDGVELEEKQP